MLCTMLFVVAIAAFALCCTGENPTEATKSDNTSTAENLKREQYEWCNIWWDHANDRQTPRVLLIGDSITVGYGGAVTKALEGKARVDRLSVAFGISDPALLKHTALMLGEYKYAAISFNNGLHGWHIKDSEYEYYLKEYAQALRRLSHNAALIWVSSTPIGINGDPAVLNPELNPIVLRRNEIAERVMTELEIRVIDLYGLVIDKPELKSSDGCHFKNEGNELLGTAVAPALEHAAAAILQDSEKSKEDR